MKTSWKSEKLSDFESAILEILGRYARNWLVTCPKKTGHFPNPTKSILWVQQVQLARNPKIHIRKSTLCHKPHNPTQPNPTNPTNPTQLPRLCQPTPPQWDNQKPRWLGADLLLVFRHPSEKICASQIGNLPPFFGWKFKKYLKPPSRFLLGFLLVKVKRSRHTN